MTGSVKGAGRRRLALAAAYAAVSAAGLWLLASATTPEESKGPAVVPHPAAASPGETIVGSVRWIRNGVPRESIVLDSAAPTDAATVIFFQGRGTHRHPSGDVVTLDGAGGVLRFDSQLRIRRLHPRIDGRNVASVAPTADDGLWLATGDGEILRVGRDGTLQSTTRGAFEFSLIASAPDGTPVLVRSPDRVAFRPAFGNTPLLATLDDTGNHAGYLGSGVIPPDFLLTHLASAGRIAVTDEVIYYAPFIRDEVVALTSAGDTLWVAQRGLPQHTDEPRFEVIEGNPVVDYAPVNLGITVGPDGNVYVLSVPGFTTDMGRLDVLDPSTGHLLRSTTTPTPLPTIAADAGGRVFLLDEFRLLTGVPARERDPLPPFTLETLSGDTASLADYRGRVALINFWASWCAPCRAEMPALDALRRSITHGDFAFFTMNEDTNPAHARAFIDEFGFDFPVMLGRGGLKAEYHYIGLPFTVLVDRRGKVVERWIGYAGDEQLQAIRSVVQAELDREGGGDHAHSTGHTMEMDATHTSH